jgi:hypothetical protein
MARVSERRPDEANGSRDVSAVARRAEAERAPPTSAIALAQG